MENSKYIVGLYDHEEKLLAAIRKIRSEGVEITDALTPFPVHGIEDALGMEGTRLHTAGFMFGITGTLVALGVMGWISASNYPIDIGGKPYFSLPSFIPITFEVTVLFASVGMVIAYCIRNSLYPGFIPKIFDKRTTDDLFALTFEIGEGESSEKITRINGLLNETGAVEIKEREFEEDEEMFD